MGRMFNDGNSGTFDPRPQQRYLAKRRLEAKTYLGGSCVTCGATSDLEFDHVDPSTIKIRISTAISQHWSWDRLLTELNKCQLLCKPCHIKKTAVEMRERLTHGKYHAAYHLKCSCEACVNFKKQYKKISGSRRLPRGKFQHGTRSGYLKEKREGISPCEDCLKANAQYGRELRKRTSAGS